MDRISKGCEKNKKRWPELWPKQEPPTGRSRRKPMGPVSDLAMPHVKRRFAEEPGRGYNPEDPNIKPPSIPPPPADSGRVSIVRNMSVSIVRNMSEERLRKLIQEEIKKALNELEAEAEEEYLIEGIPVTLSDPSVASRIPAVPFPEIKAEDIQERIEKGEELVESVFGYSSADMRWMIAKCQSKLWIPPDRVSELEAEEAPVGVERGGWVRFKGGWQKGDQMRFDTQEDLDRYKNIILGETEGEDLTEKVDDNGEDEA